MPRNPSMEYITFPCSKDLKEQLERLAVEEARSLASQIRVMLSNGLRGWTKERRDVLPDVPVVLSDEEELSDKDQPGSSHPPRKAERRRRK